MCKCGRPKVEADSRKKPVSISVSEDDLEMLDNAAYALHMNRSEFILQAATEKYKELKEHGYIR